MLAAPPHVQAVLDEIKAVLLMKQSRVIDLFRSLDQNADGSIELLEMLVDGRLPSNFPDGVANSLIHEYRKDQERVSSEQSMRAPAPLRHAYKLSRQYTSCLLECRYMEK